MYVTCGKKEKEWRQKDILAKVAAHCNYKAAKEGICFVLTLHALNKYFDNRDNPDERKREGLGEKYKKIYEHCKSEVNYQKKVAAAFDKYYEVCQKCKTEKEEEAIKKTAEACGYTSVHVEKESKVQDRDEAGQEIAAVLEKSKYSTVMVALRGKNKDGKETEHATAFVRTEDKLVYLDTSLCICTMTVTGREEKDSVQLADYVKKTLTLYDGSIPETIRYASIK